MLGVTLGIVLKGFILELFHQWSLRREQNRRGPGEQRRTEYATTNRPVLYATAKVDSHLRTIEQPAH